MLLKSLWSTAYDKKVSPSTSSLNHLPVDSRVIAAGRSAAGKDLLFAAMFDVMSQLRLPSGLQLDVPDPKMMAKSIQKHRTTRSLLRQGPNASTLEFEQLDYGLFSAADQIARCQYINTIGQVLTSPDSSPERAAQFTKFCDFLAGGDVLWFLIPCPPRRLTAEDEERFKFDLNVMRPYLREAIHSKKRRRPCSVAFVLTKLDAGFESEEEARAQLPDSRLLAMLGSVINVVKDVPDTRVSHAAIFPVSAFGFDNGVPIERDSNADDPTDWDDLSYELSEPSYALRTGASFGAFNIPALVVFSMLGGLWHQEVYQGAFDDPLAATCRALSEDLHAISSWFLPIKGQFV